MRAVELRSFGGPDGLVAAELPDPEPGPGEVRVDLVAAALNRRDWWIRTGGKVQLPVVLGSDGAGHVSQLGSDVDGVEIGDEVVIEGSLAKNGTRNVNAKNVTMASTGKKLGAASSQGNIVD